MEQWVLALLGPAMALAGVTAGIWIGHRHWRHEQRQLEETPYRDKLRSAYLELWDVVEESHLQMRASLDGLSAETFSGYLADVNNFMIRRGLYIERRDRYLVLEYLFWTNEFLRHMAQTSAGREAVVTSLIHDDEFPKRLRLLPEVQGRHEQLREQLRQRIREVAGAPVSDGWTPERRPSERLLAQLDDLVSTLEKRREAEIAASRDAHELSHPEPLSLPPLNLDDL